LGYKTHYRDRLRKDIENVLKPYRIMPPFRLRHGYFAGTGILTEQELKQVYSVLAGQAKTLDDPLALSAYETLKQRLALSKKGVEDVYPVRAIANRALLDRSSLYPALVSQKLEAVEIMIDQGELAQLKLVDASEELSEREGGYFSAWPLQLVFYNFSWYLAFECEGGRQPGLIRLEPLDCLLLGEPTGQIREQKVQRRSLHKLQTLLDASAGVFLGDSAGEQQAYLSQKKISEVEVGVELWFNESMFRSVSESSHRFSSKHIKMSPPLEGASVSKPETVYSLARTADPKFPHRFQIILPQWSLEDVDLLGWILGFGGQVKVVEPQSLVERVKAMTSELAKLYK
jgi:hypothetical protein